MDTVIERLGATVAESLPVKLGSPANAEAWRKEWEYLLTGKITPQATPASWWEQLLAAGKEYLLTKEQIEAQARAAEAVAKTAELPPAKEKTWLEKNWWVVPLGLVGAVLLTAAAVK